MFELDKKSQTDFHNFSPGADYLQLEMVFRDHRLSANGVHCY